MPQPIHVCFIMILFFRSKATLILFSSSVNSIKLVKIVHYDIETFIQENEVDHIKRRLITFETKKQQTYKTLKI